MKQQTPIFHSRRGYDKVMIYATDFATEYFGYETTRYCCIWTVFS
jgi:hypothetical protein